MLSRLKEDDERDWVESELRGRWTASLIAVALLVVFVLVAARQWW